MIKIKKSFFVAILGAVALAASALAFCLPKASKTVSASAETTYTTVDVPVFAKISQEYSPNGNFNLFLSLPELDVDLSKGAKTVSGVDLQGKFNELNFFDNVLIGNKTLKELGCEGFWTQEVGFGENEPKNDIRLKCHADPTTWNAALSAGDVVFGQSEVTVKEGTLIPGYAYLTGSGAPVVYRASMDCIARVPNPDVSYSRIIYGQTDVDALQLTRAWNAEESSAYLGVSLENDDYLGDGSEELLYQDSKHPFLNNSKFFLNSILVNGQKGNFDYYGLFNLDEKGVGYYSFVMKTNAEVGSTITIPKGTLFPMRAINEFRKYNTPHTVFMVYETQTEQTFYLAEDGVFYDYFDYLVVDLESYNGAEGYYREAEAMQRAQIIEAAKAEMLAGAGASDWEATLANAKAAIDALKTAAQYADEELASVKAAARTEISDYLKDTVYLEEEATERAQAIETGLNAVAAATTEEEIADAVAVVKAAIDGLKAKQYYVDLAVAELTAYKADGEYYDEQVAERNGIVSAAQTAIQNAKSYAAITAELAAAKAKIDEVKTIEQVLESYKAEALGKINEKKATVDYADYALKEVHDTINQAYFNAKKAVEAAKTYEEVDTAVDTFIKAINTIEESKISNEGCGSMIGACAGFGVLTLLGGAILLKKRKEQ